MEAEPGWRCVTVRGLELRCRIGVTDEERRDPQPVRIEVALAVAEQLPVDDDLSKVVDYVAIVDRVRAAVDGPPVRLVETLAERIAAACLFDPTIGRVRVRIEKPDAVPGAIVGVAIERRALGP